MILATYNEGPHVEATLRSLLEQKRRDFELEILVIDGGSSDETVSLVKPFLSDQQVKLLRNPARSAPAAFNLGLRAAAGEYVCILGAHARYAPDYIQTCYRELMAQNADGCSGSMITVPANDSASAKLAAWCLGHAFASSPNSVRTQGGGFADTIPYPIFRKEVLLAAGGYNEQLIRNQDNDMNHRLRTAGRRLYLTSKTYATYIARPDIRSLWSYAYRTGKWNAYTLGINASCMRLRHFVPLGFSVSLIAGLLGAFGALLTHHSRAMFPMIVAFILGMHLVFGLIAAVQCSIAERSLIALLLPFVILGFHLAYGFGTLAGFPTVLRDALVTTNTTRASLPS